MDTYETEYKKSPYAQSPYECAWAESQPSAPCVEVVPKTQKSKRGIKPLVAVILLVVCCVGTAVGVSVLWQGKIDKMEAAMDDKFAALKQLYTESQSENATQLPNQGPLTPGQVYARNVQAVVAVNARYESDQGLGESVGSGFLISADGYVVTNYHVIANATSAAVTTHAGKSVDAKVIGFDSSNDIALLKIDGENYPFAVLGSSDKIAVGDQVMAIGNPLGELTATLTVGYISAKDRIVNSDGTVLNMLQTDAAINSGNSGGPLFNTNGEVIGIITAKYSGSSDSGATIEGLGFAIPVDDVAGILHDLRTYGYVTGAYLGIYARDVDSSAQSYGLPAGAYVEKTMNGYCAEAAGIRAGDIIINLGGYDVDSLNSLSRALRRFKAGDTTSITVCRNGNREYLTITFDEKPVEQTQLPTQQPAQQPTNPSASDWFDDWLEDFLYPFS